MIALAEGTGLYRIFGDEDVLLYIGVSDSFGVRWKQHAKVQPWWGEVRRLEVVWIHGRDEAEAAERAAIKAERPKYNKIHAVRPGDQLRPRCTEPPAARTGFDPRDSRTWPACMDVPTAARCLGLGRSRAYELARTGSFPVPVLRIGSSPRVTCASVIAHLEAERRETATLARTAA